MIIKIEPYENGGHPNQSIHPKFIPDGWAIIPDDLETLNFPFGDVEVENIDGVMTVTKWIPKDIPQIPIVGDVEEITATDILNALTGGVD